MTTRRLALAAACALALGLGTAQAAKAGPLRPDEALSRLKDGNARYVKGKLKHPNAAPARRAEVAQKQTPFAAILSCADSRVPPEIVFDQGVGDLFVVRTAGQAVGDIELASLEYAVEHLGASMIVVLGHERCGAVKATLEAVFPPPVTLQGEPGGGHGGGASDESHAGASGGDEDAHGGGHEDAHGAGHAPAHGEAHGASHGVPATTGHGGGGHGKGGHGAHAEDIDSGAPEVRDHIESLVALLKPAVQGVADVAPAERLDAAVVRNVQLIVARLVKDSPLLKSFLIAGRIRIVGARYDLDTGEVKLLR